MSTYYCNLNIRYDLPKTVWDKMVSVYAQAPGWMGFGDGEVGERGIPYWFGFDSSAKHITASVEPSGLQFAGENLSEDEWNDWIMGFKKLATRELGFKVGELELGEVTEEIEWL